jgi:predicted nucleic acid-binding protein
VPALWRLEVLNALQVAVRRGRITVPYRDVSLIELRALSIAIDRGTNRQAWSGTPRLCDRFGLTSYDAAYLEVALRGRLPLATLDGELARAAEAETCRRSGRRSGRVTMQHSELNIGAEFWCGGR